MPWSTISGAAPGATAVRDRGQHSTTPQAGDLDAADVEALCASTGFSRFPVAGEGGDLLGAQVRHVLPVEAAHGGCPGDH